MPRGRIPKREQTVLRDDKSNYLDKELEAEKRSKIYSTEKIDNILKNINDPHVDMMPFFHGKTDWRNADIQFEYTEEEWDILNRCTDDPIWFVENYCTFMTDYGRKTVSLRPYQKDVIHLFCDEHYSEEYELILPDNRRVILLQSRQTGKCISCKNHVNLHDNSRKNISDIYIENTRKTFLDRLTYHFMNRKGRLSSYITKFLLSLKYGFQHDNKIVASFDVDYNLKSSNGKYVHASQFHITRPYKTYELILSNYPETLLCADEHFVYSSDLKGEHWRHVSDLSHGDFVYTELGWKMVKEVKKHKYSEYMFDFSVDDESHAYYTNGILSHNTTTTAAIFAWYLTFHHDKNAMVVANKGQTAEEILGKMMDVFKGLPFFMKPGIVSKSQSAIRFENGCSLRCSATSDTPATGDTIHILMIDECALIPANKIQPFWASVWPTMSSSVLSQVIVLSTPRGRHNLYYDLYSGAIKGTNGFKYKRVDYWEVPGHDTEEWKQDQISVFGEALFNQEFALSFDSDQTKLLGPKDLQFYNRIRKEFRPVDIYGIPYSVSQKILWHPDFNPDQLTIEDLLSMRILLQIDTAEGKQKGEKGQEDPDWNIINIFKIEFMSPARIRKNRMGYKKVELMDCIRLRQIGIYMDQDFDEEKCAGAAQHIVFSLFKNGLMYGDYEIDNTRIMVEINFNGANWIKEFLKHDLFYQNIIIKTFHSQKATKKELGFKTVSGTRGKGYYCEEGAKLCQRRQIIVSQDHNIPVQSTLQQLEAFGKNKNNVYEGSCMHDDIATATLFTSIAFEQEEFVMWIEDWMLMLPQLFGNNPGNELLKKLDQITEILEIYVRDTVETDEYTEDQVVDLITSASSSFNMAPQQNMTSDSIYGGSSGYYGGMPGSQMPQNPYGGQQMQNPLYGQGSGFSQMGMGGGVTMPKRR